MVTTPLIGWGPLGGMKGAPTGCLLANITSESQGCSHVRNGMTPCLDCEYRPRRGYHRCYPWKSEWSGDRGGRCGLLANDLSGVF